MTYGFLILHDAMEELRYGHAVARYERPYVERYSSIADDWILDHDAIKVLEALDRCLLVRLEPREEESNESCRL